MISIIIILERVIELEIPSTFNDLTKILWFEILLLNNFFVYYS